IVIGSVIGSSIFMKPATMAAQLSSPLMLLAVWVVAGVVSMFGSMINAEVGCAMPETGGQYVYFRYMYGNFFAYLFGWSSFVVIDTASISGIAFVFAQYSEYFVHLPRFSPAVEHTIPVVLPYIGRFYLLENIGVKVVAVLLVVVFSWVNVRSVKVGGAVQVFFSALKIAALVFLIGVIFFSGQGHTANLVEASPNFNRSYWHQFTAFIAATTGALAAYDGWNNLGFIGGEIREPQKNIPRGLMLGMLLCIILYVLTTEAYLYMMPVDEMKNSSLVASDALYKIMGVAGGGLIAALVLLSTAGCTNSNILPCSRVIFAMSQEKNFFQFAGKVNPKYNTPSNALWLQAAWATVLILIGSFDMLMDMFVFITWIFYGFAAYGIFIVRRRMPGKRPGYRLKGYPVLPVIFILFSTLYVVITLYNDINDYIAGRSHVIVSVFGLVLVAIGIPLFWYFRRKQLS
ncbi:MAG: amino acid permease, partial [Bacteroidetes bacterium]|nr:amino acid permease [Bacteroidota bacterium]